MIGIGIGLLILVLIMSTMIVVNFAPQFGKGYDKEQKKQFSQLDHYEDGKFINQSETGMELDYWYLIKEQFRKDPSRSPQMDILPNRLDSLDIENRSGLGNYISWMGHSAFLLELDGKKILLDPMLGNSPAPFDFLGPSRYSSELAIAIEKLPKVDILIISHDHYDHLDHGSIIKLKEKVERFFVPLGVGSHLEHWGIEKNKIREMNWWDTDEINGIELTLAPARHFSGRGILDRNKTLWGSWIIKSDSLNIYFSGDGGYDTHFKEIGEKYGPFDLALMECGQYHEQWHQIHMMPEETVMAAKDVKANVFMPIHWGAFTLALHSWTDPVERAKAKADELGIKMTTPFIGETLEIKGKTYPKEEWWREY